MKLMYLIDDIMDIENKGIANYSEITPKDTLEKGGCEGQDFFTNSSRGQHSQQVQDAIFLNTTLHQSPLSPEMSYIFLTIYVVFMLPELWGYYPDSTNCINYYICSNGIAERMTCKTGKRKY